MNSTILPHCLTRGFLRYEDRHEGDLSGAHLNPSVVKELLGKQHYDSFRNMTEIMVHNAIHWGVRGDFAQWSSANGLSSFREHSSISVGQGANGAIVEQTQFSIFTTQISTDCGGLGNSNETRGAQSTMESHLAYLLKVHLWTTNLTSWSWGQNRLYLTQCRPILGLSAIFTERNSSCTDGHIVSKEKADLMNILGVINIYPQTHSMRKIN